MRRTRSSARQEPSESAVNNDDAEDEGYAIVPPRPPPPPPPRRPSNNTTTQTVAVQTSPRPSSWTLTLFTPSPIRIAITPEMTPEILGKCILQAKYGCHSLDDVDTQVAVRKCQVVVVCV